MYAVSLETIGVVERVVKEEGIACDFSRTGHLEVACKQVHFDDYARQVEVIAREFNHQLRIVTRDELRSEIGSNIYYGGMVDEISAGLNPARYVAGLATAAMRAGAQICERARLQNIQREARGGVSGFKLNTSRGAVWAHNVLVGTSGYTGAATPALRKKIIPIGSFIITTEVLPEALARELSPPQSSDLTIPKTIFITIALRLTIACCSAGAPLFSRRPIRPSARAPKFFVSA